MNRGVKLVPERGRQFSGKPAQLRHRMIYDALGAMMHKEIHALAIKAYAPEEI